MRKEIIKTLFGIGEGEIATAWDLNIDFIRSVMDTSMNRRENDIAERGLLKHIKKHHLEMLDNEDGLCTHELAMAKSIEYASPVDSIDVVLVNEFKDYFEKLPFSHNPPEILLLSFHHQHIPLLLYPFTLLIPLISKPS